MSMLNEVEAAQALGELARERRRAGRPGLDPAEAAFFLRSLADVRSLPEVGAARAGARRIPHQRRRARLGRSLLNPQQ